MKAAVGADDYNPSWKCLGFGGNDEAKGEPSPAITVKRMLEAGVGINVWTVNDEKSWKALLDIGVTGIITDAPDLLRAWLKKQ